MMSVYVAASSAELPRAKLWMAKLRAAGITVTSDWPETIERVGDANPRNAGVLRRREWASYDLDAVDEATWFWLLAPASTPARGAYCELGFAVAQRKIVVSSGDTEQSIFLALGQEFDTDAEAFDYLVAHQKGTR